MNKITVEITKEKQVDIVELAKGDGFVWIREEAVGIVETSYTDSLTVRCIIFFPNYCFKDSVQILRLPQGEKVTPAKVEINVKAE